MTQDIVELDGIKLQIIAPDIDGDGVKGGVEAVEQATGEPGITQIHQPTELGESIGQLFNDGVEKDSFMSGIDMRSILAEIEISSILAMDYLVSANILPKKCLSFTRQKKRLSCSLAGKGRQDIVDVVAGKRDQEQKAGFGDKFKSFFGGGNKQE